VCRGRGLKHVNIKSNLHLKLVWAQMKDHRHINDKDFKTKEIEKFSEESFLEVLHPSCVYKEE
jgi:hypothetical protein